MSKKVPKKPKPAHVDHTATAYTGTLQVDASSLGGLLFDLPPGGMQGLRKARPGIDDVVAELAVAVPTYGAGAGVSTAVYQSFVDHTTDIAKLQAVGGAILKLAEVITETIAIHEDGQDQDLGQIVDAVRSTMKRKKNDGIGAPFQKTLEYRAEQAKKAVATRKKKAAAKAAAAAPAAPAPAAPAGH
jgi:hypothetical protein